MLRRFLSNGRLCVAASVALVAMVGTIMLLSCSKDNPVKAPDATWSFTVDVLDGYTGNKIANARVQYMKNQVDTFGLTNSEGRLQIEGLAAGTQSFTISNSDTTKYTSVVIQATSVSDTTGLKKLADQSRTVKLFPLTGSISGKVVSQLHALSSKEPAVDVVVAVSYTNDDLASASNVATQIKTDNTGAFSLSGLPVASGLRVTVAPTPISGIDFAAEAFDMPVLVSKINIPMGTIIMHPIDAKNFKLMSALPTVISPNQVISANYSDTLDDVSYATLEGRNGSQTVKVNCSVSGMKINVTPSISLVDGSQYLLTIYSFGKDGGSLTSSATVSVQGGGLIDVVSSNVLDANHKAKDGLGLTDSMIFVFRAAIDNASASVTKSGVVILVDVSVQGSTLVIKPKGSWEAGTYTVKVSANLHDSTASTFNFNVATVGALNFVSSNVYNPQLQTPIHGLQFKDTIRVETNKALSTAQATLVGSEPIPLSVIVNGAGIKIVPVDALRPATSYTLNVTASTAEGENRSFTSTFTTASSDFYPVTDNIRYDNDPYKPVLNFPPNGSIVIKMSSTVKSATAQMSPNVSLNVTFSSDTIKVTPIGNFTEGQNYSLRVSAASTGGTAYNEYIVYDFYVQANKVFVTASNVMNTNGLGLTNVPVTTAPFYVLSATPDAASLAVVIKPNGGAAVNATVAVSGDTVKIKPVANLNAGTVYVVTIKGKSTQNQTIDMDMNATNKAAFTTRAAVFVVATNMQDADQNPITNLSPAAELWAKFSRPLSADLTKHQLGGGAGTTITYAYGATNNNATIRVVGDTLFAKFLPNLLPAFGASISLTAISILFDDATTLGAASVNLDAAIMKKATPYVIATNGIRNNQVVDTFGVLSEAWIVSSLAFRSIDKIKDGPDGLASVTATNLVLSNVRTHGDTIFFKPAVRLGYNTEYQVAFEVTLADTSKYTGTDLKLKWKTEKALYLDSANDMEANYTAYRPFSITGDTLVLRFSKSIDTTKAFAIAGFVPRMSYVWSASKRRVKIIPSDTLTAKPYDPTLNYSINSTTGQYAAITITATTVEGESWNAHVTDAAAFNNERPPLAVHTVPGIEVLNTNLKVSAVNPSQMYPNIENKKLSDLGALVVQNDSINVTDTLKVYCTRAIDSLAVATSLDMVQLKLGVNIQNVVVWYGSDHKTLFVKPLSTMTSGAAYSLVLTKIKAAGQAATDGVTYTLGFKTRPLATKPVSTTVIALNVDTAFAASVKDKRRAYSGSKTEAYNQAGGLNPFDVTNDNKIALRWYEVAFRSASVPDTVSHYQLAVRGVDNNWYDLKDLVAAKHFAPLDPNLDSLIRYELDLSGTKLDIYGNNIAATLRVATGANSQNDANIFNYGAVVQVKVRPVVSADALWDAADKSGNWSVAVSLQDNVAPCDTDYVANTVDNSRLNTVAQGGVSVAVTPEPDGFGLDRTGRGAAKWEFSFTFPEDMDITTKPSISIFYGNATGLPTTQLSVDGSSLWNSNIYTYKLVVTVPGGVDWTTYQPYYALDISNMKDAAGQVIQTWGDAGGAANGTVRTTADDTEDKGTTNLQGLADF